MYFIKDRSVSFDSATKKAVSVRDGVLEYRGWELNKEPADKVFTVYRSPATIANVARAMEGIPLTNEHVEPFTDTGDVEIGTVNNSTMIDAFDDQMGSTVAVQNVIDLNDEALAEIESGKRELSLGYHGELVPHDKYDFEQRDIKPHHLALVPHGRCGSTCQFIDQQTEKKPMTEEEMAKLATIIASAVKEAIKPETPATDEEPKKVEATDAEPEKVDVKDSAEFKDAIAKAKAETASAIKAHGAVIKKASQFLDSDYKFEEKDTAEIMLDAVKTQFTDAAYQGDQLQVAFDMLKPVEKPSQYQNFGDSKPESGSFEDAVINSIQ